MIRTVELTEAEKAEELAEVERNLSDHGKVYGEFDELDRINYLEAKYGRGRFRTFVNKLDSEAIG